MHFDSKMVLT